MSEDLLLVGSIPLDTPEEVFRAFGPGIGEWLAYLPDGEVGDRRYWVDGIAHRVLNGHRDLETLRYPALNEDGVETWHPQSLHDTYQFRVRDGVEEVRFGDPGWKLGYTRDAVNAFFVFRQLKKDGIIPGHVRFQVCIPLTYSCIGTVFPDPAHKEIVAPGFTAALKAEVEELVRQIPPAELAIQWDLAIEHRDVWFYLRDGDIEGARREAARICAPAAEVCAVIPPETALGAHSCYGTLAGWPAQQPPDVMATVLLLNGFCAAAGRPVDFVHFPTTDRTDEAHFKPLEDLETGGARAYVGAIHHMHGPGGMAEQLGTVRKFLPDFALAAPCGFGRTPERPGRMLTDEGDAPPPDIVKVILEDHIAAVGVLAEVMAG